MKYEKARRRITRYLFAALRQVRCLMVHLKISMLSKIRTRRTAFATVVSVQGGAMESETTLSNYFFFNSVP